MNVGLIFECSPSGPDQQVCEHLLLELNPDLKLKSRTLVNKARLKMQCGIAAKELLADDCDVIGIVWDLFPTWRTNPNDVHCRGQDRDDIFASLNAAGLANAPIELICIAEELEAWLLSDERAVNEVLSRPTRMAKEKRIKRPEQVQNPKKRLGNLFKTYGKGPYNDIVHAIRIAKAIPDWTRIKNCPSFARFATRIAGVNP